MENTMYKINIKIDINAVGAMKHENDTMAG